MTIPQSSMTPQSQGGQKKEPLGSSMFFLALMITSMFYVLPLGRFQILGYSSDFRIYDFTFILFLLFIGHNLTSRLQEFIRNRSQFHVYALILIIMVIFSLSLTWIARGTSEMPPVLIRTYRFIMYFLVGTLAFTVINSPRRQRFALGVFYVNILIQTVLAFAQSMGWLSSFWPDYWLVGYGVFPVGTLSPHHLQVGVVMLIGIALSMTFFRLNKNMVIWFLLSLVIGMMMVVSIKAEIRTAWFALVGWVVAYGFIHRSKAFLPILLLGVGLYISFQVFGETTIESMQEIIDRRLIGRVQEYGVEGILGDRLAIYKGDPLALITARPYIILVGAGFQNVALVLRGATGAHNNYLQVFFEIGFIGFIIYMFFLWSILAMLWKTVKFARDKLQMVLAKDAWALFIAILITMLAGETLWAQYSAFTLPGQIMMIVAIAVSPLNWLTSHQGTEDNNN